MRRVIIFATGLMILVLSGCANYQYPVDCPTGAIGVSFSGDLQPIFNSNCSCHSGGQAPALIEGWAYDELTEGGYVDTDSPCESALYQIFGGTHDGRADSVQINQILGWIHEGAQDN
jgi:hypothetical protein